MDEIKPSSNIQEQMAFRLQPSLELQTEQTSPELTRVSAPPGATESGATFSFCTSPHPPQSSHCSVHPLSGCTVTQPSEASLAPQHPPLHHAQPVSSTHPSSTSDPLFPSRCSINAAAPSQSMLQAILAEVGASTPPPGPGTDANMYWNKVLQDHLRQRLRLHQQLRQQQRQSRRTQSVPGPLFEDPQFHHCMSLRSSIPLLSDLPVSPVWSSISNNMDPNGTTSATAIAQTTVPSTAFASACVEDATTSLQNSSEAGPTSSSTLDFHLTMADMDSCMGHQHHCPNTPSFGTHVLSSSPSAVCRHSAQGADAFERDLTALVSSSVHTLGLQGVSPSLSHSASSTPSPATSPSSSPSPSITAAMATPTSKPAKQMIISPLLPCPVPHCPRSFTRAFNLNAHLRTQHNLDPQDLGSLMPFASSVPSSPTGATISDTKRTSSSSSSVISKASCSSASSTHQQQQSKLFPCHLCARIFSRKHDLQRHIRVHTGSKPYLCMNCQKAFARTDALNRHYKVEEACRQMVVHLEAGESARRTQQSQAQQTLQLEVKEWQKAQMLRQFQPQHLPHTEQQLQPQPQDSFGQHYFHSHHHSQQQTQPQPQQTQPQQSQQSQQAQQDYLGPNSIDTLFHG